MDKAWGNFMIRILCVLIFLLSFVIVNDEIRKNKSFGDETANTYDKVTLYDKNGNVLYQCETDNNIDVQIKDGEISVFTPYESCSCFAGE